MAKIGDLQTLRKRIGTPGELVPYKIHRRLNARAAAFIGKSPLFMLSTAGADGRPTVSPKGDPAGFVHVADDRTLLIPERKGNKLIMGLQNILANGRVALIFLVPGTEETFRVHGTAELTADPAVLARLEQRGKPALLAIRVRVERCFFHCAKAFKRASLWKPETWPEPLRISFGTMFAKKYGADAELAAKIDAGIEADYRTEL